MERTRLNGSDSEWWRDHLGTDISDTMVIAKNAIGQFGSRQPIQTYDISQIFSIMMGLVDDSVPLELPQIEFYILQNWTQIAVVFTQQAGNQIIKNYSAVIAYNGIMSEEKRRELYQFLTDYFLEEHEVFSLVIQQLQQIARS